MSWEVLLPTGCNFGALTSATHITVVPAPGPNHARNVYTLTVHNNSATGIQVNLFILEPDATPTRYQIDGAPVAPGATYSLSDKFPNGIFLRDAQYLQLNAGATTTEDWYCAWADLPQLGYGWR